MKQTTISRAGLRLARHIAQPYQRHGGVRGIIAGGSVGRGWADQFSDLEIGIFWETMPTPDVRREIIEHLRAEVLAFDRDGAVGREHLQIRETEGYTGTSMVSCIHMPIEMVDSTISSVVDQLDTTIEKQSFLSALYSGEILHGTRLIGAWRSRIDPYPEDLAIKIIQENLWFGPFYMPEAYIDRADFLVLYHHYMRAEQCMLRILAALNCQYFPSEEFKWTPHLLSDFEIKPSDAANRMRQVFSVSLSESWPLLKSLLQDVIDLVETHLPNLDSKPLFADKPEIDTAWAKARLESSPPYTLAAQMAASEDA